MGVETSVDPPQICAQCDLQGVFSWDKHPPHAYCLYGSIFDLAKHLGHLFPERCRVPLHRITVLGSV